MKRVVAVMLVSIMMIMAFSGCNSSKTTSSDVQKFAIWTTDSHSRNFYTKKIEEFNKTIGKEMGIEIEYTIKPDCSKEVELAFTSDQAPDMMVGNLKKLAGAGNIIAFEDIDGGQAMIDSCKDFIVPKKNIGDDGKTYSLPFSITTVGMVYNKDMFKAAGIVDENGEAKPPKTWDEYIEDAKKLTNASKQEYGVIFNGKDDWYSANVGINAVSNGGYIDGYDPYTGVFTFKAQAKMMKKMLQIKKDGSYLPGMDGLNNDSARAKFAAGGIGMKAAQSFDYAVFTEQFPAECDWGVARLPVFEEDEFTGQFGTFTGGWLINKEAVEKFGAKNVLAIYDYFRNDEFQVEMYKAGAYIPYNYDLIKDVKLDKSMENWEAFGKMLAYTYNSPQYITHEYDATGIKGLNEVWKELWAGKTPESQIDSICDAYAKAVNDGKAKYIASHPDYKAPALVSKDYKVYTAK